ERGHQLFLAAALPPLRPAATFCACVPPCDELLREDVEFERWPPRFEDPDELAILAARSFDMPLSFRASYCFSFLTFARLPGISSPPLANRFDQVPLAHLRAPRDVQPLGDLVDLLAVPVFEVPAGLPAAASSL